MAMDLLTRKKLLMRKYNNPTFTIEELDFFGKINATEIIVLLKENPVLRVSNKFFQHASIREIEKIIASIFEPQESFARSQIFNILVNLLRDNTTVMQVCFKNEQFNYMSMFGFLQQEHIDYAILILLEDVLLPYIRKTPSQLIKILGNDQHVQNLLLRRVYEKPIFKIMYTVIFCLSKRHSQQYKPVIRRIIHQLVNTPFTYLRHRDKKIQQKITIIAQDTTEVKSPEKSDNKGSKYLETSTRELFPLVHNKKVRDKKKNDSSIDSIDLKSVEEQELFSTKKNSNGSTMKKSQQSRSSIQFEQLMSEKNLSNGTHHYIFSAYENRNIQSLADLQEHAVRQIPLNEDLCYGDLTENMRQLLSDISLNIKYVYIKNVLWLLQNFNQAYVDSLIANVRRYVGVQQYESYCYGAMFILYEFGQLYKAVINYEKTIPKNSNHRESNTNESILRSPSTTNDRQRSTIISTAIMCTQYEAELNSLIKKLEKQLKIIATKIPHLANCLLQNNQPSIEFSSGQKLRKVTMAKYKIIDLITQLLMFNSNKDSKQAYLDLTENINFNQIPLYEVVNKYLLTVKWNNILHTAIIKLMKLLLQQDYQGFKSKCIINTQPQDSILGTLLEIYRNKKYVHLATMKLTNYGNLHTIYDITALIMEHVITNGDYNLLIQRFKPFQNFIHNDILGYQSKADSISQWFDQKIMIRESQNIQCSVPCQDMNGKIISASLQNAEELMSELENSKRWISFNLARKQTI